MGLVTVVYAVIAGLIGGLAGALIFTLVRRLMRPRSSIGWDFLTFFIAFAVCGIICAAATILIMVKAFTGGFN